MPVFFGIIATVVLTVIAVVVFGVWGAPFSLIIGVLAILYVAKATKSNGEPAVTMERGRRQEPTGMPRPASGNSQTANERVGQ